ncbi:MAG: hypothetical protein ACRBCJ_02015 [Hyphomicrobiaceae bacterium]
MIDCVFARPRFGGLAVFSVCLTGVSAFAFALCCTQPSPVAAEEPTKSAVACVRDDFEAVVDEAGAALRELNQANKPKFQNRLRKLKEKFGWSHEAFLKNAVPYVRDEQITVYDRKSTSLLNEISSLGEEGAEATVADCDLLTQLRARMDVLVKTQNEKWSYMFSKLEKALR